MDLVCRENALDEARLHLAPQELQRGHVSVPVPNSLDQYLTKPKDDF